MFKVIINFPSGESSEEDEVFESENEAIEYGQYLCSCYSLGAELSHMSNPGDYPDETAEAEYEIYEI